MNHNPSIRSMEKDLQHIGRRRVDEGHQLHQHDSIVEGMDQGMARRRGEGVQQLRDRDGVEGTSDEHLLGQGQGGQEQARRTAEDGWEDAGDEEE